jgi:hypothetical protein
MKQESTMTNVEKINLVVDRSKHYISPERADQILSSEYQKQAVDFLIETKTTCEIEFIGLRKPNWDNGKREVNSYKVTLKNARHTWSFDFFDSVHNTEKNIRANYNFYSVLSCMGHYTPESFDEFCSDYGYEFKNETEYIKAKSIHLACLDQDKNLRKLFTEEQMQKLSEIN